MKQGTTTTFNFHFNIDLNQVNSIDFFFHCDRDNKQKRQPLLTKSYPTDGYEQDGVIYMPLKQEETAVLPNKFYIEPQINFIDKSSTKAHTKAYNMEPTIYTHFIDENQSSGEEENIDIEFEVDESIVIKGYDYDESYHKPRINDNELAGNKTGAELGLQDKLIAGVNITIAADGKTISAANGGKFIIVEELPEEDIDLTAIYLLPREDEEESNIYDEYIYIDNISEWEKIGSTEVNLENYYTKEQTDDLLDNKQDTLSANGHISITNDVITTEGNKVYRAVMSGGNISYNVSDYPNIQYGDIAIIKQNDKFRIWTQEVYPDSSVVYWSEIEYSQQKITQSQNTPPTETGANGSYIVGDLWVQKKLGSVGQPVSYKVFVLVDIAQTPPPRALTWVDLTSGNYTSGNGIKIENDKISIDITSDTGLGFNDGRLTINNAQLGRNRSLRQALVSTYFDNPLASKQYVDNLVSGRLKRLVVESLPTQDIDANTIYMILKSVPSTNNIYDEYMYINSAWELIGSTEVDLSNYYTKIETDDLLDSKQDTLSATGHISITNNVISTDANRIYSAKYDSNGDIKKEVSEYDGIKSQDLIFDNRYQRLHQVATIQMGYVSLASIRNAEYISGEPLTETRGPQYYKNVPYFSDNGNIYMVDTVSNVQATYTYTWLTYNGKVYSGGNGIDISNGTISIDLKSGSKLQFDNGELDVDLSNKQDAIDSSHKLDANLVDDTNSTNKFVTLNDITNWNGKADAANVYTKTEVNNTVNNINNDINNVSNQASCGISLANDAACAASNAHNAANDAQNSANNAMNVANNAQNTADEKADKTIISIDSSTTMAILTLVDNHEYRYTQDLTNLVLTMPNGDFIAGVVFSSGSTPTQIVCDSGVKWSGEAVDNNVFTPEADTVYNVVFWYDGININAVERGVV